MAHNSNSHDAPWSVGKMDYKPEWYLLSTRVSLLWARRWAADVGVTWLGANAQKSKQYILFNFNLFNFIYLYVQLCLCLCFYVVFHVFIFKVMQIQRSDK